jgi:hypothetical protein
VKFPHRRRLIAPTWWRDPAGGYRRDATLILADMRRASYAARCARWPLRKIRYINESNAFMYELARLPAEGYVTKPALDREDIRLIL